MLITMLVVLNPLNWQLLQAWWLPPLVFVLDMAIVDLSFPPHPVRAIGWFLNQLAKPLFVMKRKIIGGALAVLFCLASSMLICAWLMALPGFFGVFFSIYLGFSGMALGELLRAGEKAVNALECGTIEEARFAVGGLVSRDVENMDAPELYRSLAESLSENFCDAFVGPFFWLVLTGPAGLWAYKTISTMDSMWGYKTEPWTKIGMPCAKVEDGMSFIPARLSAFTMFLAAPLAGFFCTWKDFRKAKKQAKNMESPNSGFPMAVAALVHRGRMGGPTVYHGEIKEKPLLGPETENYAGELLWTKPKIKDLIRHLKISGAVAVFLIWGLAVLCGVFIRR